MTTMSRSPSSKNHHQFYRSHASQFLNISSIDVIIPIFDDINAIFLSKLSNRLCPGVGIVPIRPPTPTFQHGRADTEDIC